MVVVVCLGEIYVFHSLACLHFQISSRAENKCERLKNIIEAEISNLSYVIKWDSYLLHDFIYCNRYRKIIFHSMRHHYSHSHMKMIHQQITAARQCRYKLCNKQRWSEMCVNVMSGFWYVTFIRMYSFYNDDNAQNKKCPKWRFNADRNPTWTNMNIWLYSCLVYLSNVYSLFHIVIVFFGIELFSQLVSWIRSTLEQFAWMKLKTAISNELFWSWCEFSQIWIYLTIDHKFEVIFYFVSHSGFFSS